VRAKNFMRQMLFFAVYSALAQAQITPSQDAYTNSAVPKANYGANGLLYVSDASEVTYIQFNLPSIPSGATVSQATLKLFVNGVGTAGSFNVDFVNGSWTESTISYALSPALGASIVSSLPTTTAQKNNYILIDVTAAVDAWLVGKEPNDGIALVANGTTTVSFDSKENTGTSHPPELDIILTSGGTITGVTTAAGSGLTGGATSGTVNLSLTTACATNQVLQWNGSDWACANLSAGGTITGVATPLGSGLTGGGASGNVTLAVDPTQVPFLVANNTFTGNQTVSGNVSATGMVTGTAFNIGSNLFAFGSYTNNNAFLGFSGNSTMTGQYNTANGFQALLANTSGLANTGTGAWALYSNQTGNNNAATGAQALYSNTTGIDNTAIGTNALISNTTGGDNTATGSGALYYNTKGNFNTATGFLASSANITGSKNAAFGFKALLNNTTGTDNMASGYEALYSNTTGYGNTASGFLSLQLNTTGYANTSLGGDTLLDNTTGNGNTGTGDGALLYNTTGNFNTGVGFDSGLVPDASGMSGQLNTFLGAYTAAGTGALNNATAVGAYAEVGANNSLVLGSIAGVNNCTAANSCASTNVGIGTTTPTLSTFTAPATSPAW